MKRTADNPLNQAPLDFNQINLDNYQNLLRAINLVSFAEGSDVKSAIITSQCCKALHEMSNSSEMTPYWKSSFYEKFKSSETNEQFQVNVKWKDLFCKYASTLYNLNMHKNKMLEKGANFFISMQSNIPYAVGLFGILSSHKPELLKNRVEQKKELIDEIALYCLAIIESKDKLLDKKEVGKVLTPFITDLLQADANPIAQYCLGIAYANGFGINKNLKEACRYLQLSSNQGNAKAQLALGSFYYKGLGCEIDLKKAFEQFKLSADQGNVYAQTQIIFFYKNGCGTDVNLIEAFNYTKLSADKGDSIGQYYLAWHYKNGIGVPASIDEMFKYLRLSADQGHAQAQCELGKYYEGLNVKLELADTDLAFKYSKLSADQGNHDAQCHVAFHYMSGVRKDPEQSFKYFKLSADKGNAVAQCYLGLHFLNGDGTPINLIEAFKYIKLSADKENAEGQVWLARCYVEGFGVEINLEKAIEYYDLVAVKEGKNKDYAKQALSEYIEEYKLLANQGDASAQYLMSVLFSTKTFSNPVEALKYYKLSADQGNVQAQVNVKLLNNRVQ